MKRRRNLLDAAAYVAKASGATASLPTTRESLSTSRESLSDLLRTAAPRDASGRRRSAATFPEFHAGRSPGNAGRKYPPTPPTPAEVLRLLEHCSRTAPTQIRNRALIVVLWRAGVRISEALALTEHDIDHDRGTVHVRCGKGGKQRYSAIDPWALEQLAPWLELRRRYPAGPLFCVVEGRTRGRAIRPAQFRSWLHLHAASCGITKRIAPHQLRHAHAVDLATERVGVHLIQRQLGHSNLAVTTNYLAGVSPVEVIDAIGARPAPVGIRRDEGEADQHDQ